MSPRDRRVLALIVASAAAFHAAANKRLHPLHVLGIALGFFGGFGDGPTGAAQPVRRR